LGALNTDSSYRDVSLGKTSGITGLVGSQASGAGLSSDRSEPVHQTGRLANLGVACLTWNTSGVSKLVAGLAGQGDHSARTSLCGGCVTLAATHT